MASYHSGFGLRGVIWIGKEDKEREIMRLKWRNILLVARSEFVRWILSPRMVVVLGLILPIRELIVLPMADAAGKMGQPLNFFEAAIGVANSGLVLLLLPLAYLVLTSSFPTVDGNMLPYIMRMGRANWILGEMLFQTMAAVAYCFMILGIVVAQTANISFLANGWSIPVTDYDKVFGNNFSGFRMSSVVLPNIYQQMPPYKALYLSYGLLALFLLLCSMAFLLGSLYGKKLLAFFLLAAQTALGCGLAEIKNTFMWLFPFAHSVLAMHYQKYFRRYVFSPWVSMGLLGAALAGLALGAYWKAKKADLDQVGGGLWL